MFEIGWTELMLIGIVALIVIGPKDLPDMFRTMGRFTAKMRGMARDFQRAMDQAAKESGVNDIAADLKAATSAKSMGLEAVKDAASRFEKWDPLKPASAVKPAAAVPLTSLATPTVHAPAAQVLTNAKAAKAAVAAKAAAKSQTSKPPTSDPVSAQAAKPVRKPRATKATVAVADKPAPKPRAPRKPAKDA